MKSSTFFFLLVLFSSLRLVKGPGAAQPLVEHHDPDLSKAKGLICFQCRSMSSEKVPLCDRSVFRLAKKEERNNMSLQCPHYQGSYCVWKQVKRGIYYETLRGCVGPTDKKGYDLKVGCLTKEREKFCLCDTNLCNTAFSLVPLRVVTFLPCFIFYSLL